MQRHSRLLIEELAKDESLDLIVIHPHDEQVFNQPSIVEIPIQGIDEQKTYLKECRKYSKRVYDVLRSYPNAIIYSQGISVWHKCGEFSNRLIVNPHGLEPFQALSKKDKIIGFPFRKIFNYIFNKSKYVVSLGGNLTNILSAGTTSYKLIILPNAVNIPSETMNKIYPDQNEKIKLFFVSRFAANKGIKLLMQAISELNEEGFSSNIEYSLGGKGPLYEEIVKKYQFDNVKYWGFISDEDLVANYQNSDAFVFPTLFEGMPTVVLEAMSHRLPIIVSDTGATAELVDNTNGFLINKNDVPGIKEAIKQFYRLTSEEKQNLSAASLQKVKDRFTWQAVALAHKELFQRIERGLQVVK